MFREGTVFVVDVGLVQVGGKFDIGICSRQAHEAQELRTIRCRGEASISTNVSHQMIIGKDAGDLSFGSQGG